MMGIIVVCFVTLATGFIFDIQFFCCTDIRINKANLPDKSLKYYKTLKNSTFEISCCCHGNIYKLFISFIHNIFNYLKLNCITHCIVRRSNWCDLL